MVRIRLKVFISDTNTPVENTHFNLVRDKDSLTQQLKKGTSLSNILPFSICDTHLLIEILNFNNYQIRYNQRQ